MCEVQADQVQWHGVQGHYFCSGRNAIKEKHFDAEYLQSLKFPNSSSVDSITAANQLKKVMSSFLWCFDAPAYGSATIEATEMNVVQACVAVSIYMFESCTLSGVDVRLRRG